MKKKTSKKHFTYDLFFRPVHCVCPGQNNKNIKVFKCSMFNYRFN